MRTRTGTATSLLHSNKGAPSTGSSLGGNAFHQVRHDRGLCHLHSNVRALLRTGGHHDSPTVSRPVDRVPRLPLRFGRTQPPRSSERHHPTQRQRAHRCEHTGDHSHPRQCEQLPVRETLFGGRRRECVRATPLPFRRQHQWRHAQRRVCRDRTRQPLRP